MVFVHKRSKNSNNLFIRIYIIVSILLQLTISSQKKQIFIDYSNWGGEAIKLFEYYSQINQGLYVDLGSYDPIQISNTLNLYVQGWRGINVEANSNRLKSFHYLREDEINLAFAVGQDEKYVTLYQSSIGPESTISQKMRDYLIKQKNTTIVEELKVPSVSLKYLCEHFYKRKITFLNLDIEGYEGKALEDNNWNNPFCRPQLIIVQQTNTSNVAGFLTPNSVLLQKNFTQVSLNLGNNEVYVANQVLQMYKQRQKVGNQRIQQMQIVKFSQISLSIQRHLNLQHKYIYSKKQNRHYDPINSPVYYYFSTKGSPIVCQKLLSSLGALQKKIFIFNFDIKNNQILINSNCEFKVKQKETIQGYEFWSYEFKLKGREYWQFFHIFDHQIDQNLHPAVINVESCNKLEVKQTKDSQDEAYQKLQRALAIIMFLVIIVLLFQLMYCYWTRKQNQKNPIEVSQSDTQLGPKQSSNIDS